ALLVHAKPHPPRLGRVEAGAPVAELLCATSEEAPLLLVRARLHDERHGAIRAAITAVLDANAADPLDRAEVELDPGVLLLVGVEEEMGALVALLHGRFAGGDRIRRARSPGLAR